MISRNIYITIRHSKQTRIRLESQEHCDSLSVALESKENVFAVGPSSPPACIMLVGIFFTVLFNTKWLIMWVWLVFRWLFIGSLRGETVAESSAQREETWWWMWVYVGKVRSAKYCRHNQCMGAFFIFTVHFYLFRLLAPFIYLLIHPLKSPSRVAIKFTINHQENKRLMHKVVHSSRLQDCSFSTYWI